MPDLSVLVMIPINSVKRYCIGKFMKGLDNMDLDTNQVLFTDDSVVDNSVGDMSFSQFIESNGYECLRVNKTIEAFKAGKNVPIRERLCNTRELLREEFINRKKYTHAMYLDADIIAPYDTVPRLRAHNKDIVSGLYYQHTAKKVGENFIPIFEPVAYKYNDKETWEMHKKTGIPFDNFGNLISTEELNPSRLIPVDADDIHITAIGTGCLMLSRAVMESDWSFRYNPNTPGTEDMWMSLDIKRCGFDIYLDTYVRCRHYPKPWEGPVAIEPHTIIFMIFFMLKLIGVLW